MKVIQLFTDWRKVDGGGKRHLIMFGPEVYKVPNSMSGWITFKNKYLVRTVWDFADHMVSVATIQLYCGSKAALDYINRMYLWFNKTFTKCMRSQVWGICLRP